jgi:hypothetical protein
MKCKVQLLINGLVLIFFLVLIFEQICYPLSGNLVKWICLELLSHGFNYLLVPWHDDWLPSFEWKHKNILMFGLQKKFLSRVFKSLDATKFKMWNRNSQLRYFKLKNLKGCGGGDTYIGDVSSKREIATKTNCC